MSKLNVRNKFEFVDRDRSEPHKLPVKTRLLDFKEIYDLNVQVFRRSGNIWLQTTATDHLSLSAQNEKGGH